MSGEDFKDCSDGDHGSRSACLPGEPTFHGKAGLVDLLETLWCQQSTAGGFGPLGCDSLALENHSILDHAAGDRNSLRLDVCDEYVGSVDQHLSSGESIAERGSRDIGSRSVGCIGSRPVRSSDVDRCSPCFIPSATLSTARSGNCQLIGTDTLNPHLAVMSFRASLFF